MTDDSNFATVLRQTMQRSKLVYTVGLLSKLSRVPRMTIINWLSGRVVHPRRWQELVRMAAALRLDETEASQLLQSAGHPTLGELLVTNIEPQERQLLTVWARTIRYLAMAHDTRLNGLPSFPPPLFGREDDVAAICNWLTHNDKRALALTGMGGVGKSLLALHCAAHVQPLFPDGIIWVSLTNCRDTVQIEERIAQACGLPRSEDVLSSLAAHFCGRRSLLVLDEYEPVATLPITDIQLVQALPITVLITSQFQFHSPGIDHIEISPLPPPPFDPLPPLTQLSLEPSVALFLSRARMTLPDFALTSANAVAITKLCIQLGGLPLALELAAARLKVASPQELLTHIDEQFGALQVLTGGAHNRPERHRSIRNVFDWSYARLPTQARSLFTRLAVFTGGCSLAAAAAIQACPQTDVDLAHYLDILCFYHLIWTTTVDGEKRYIMLEMAREYALEQLIAEGAYEQTLTRHGVWALALVEAAANELRGGGQVQWQAQLDRERENVHSALVWAEATGAYDYGLRIAIAQTQFWLLRNALSEGRRWIEQLLQLATTTGYRLELQLQADAFAALARLARRQRDFSSATTWSERALALYQKLGNRHGIADALHTMAALAHIQHHLTHAAVLYEASLAINREIGDVWGIATSLDGLGVVLYAQGSSQRARSLFIESLAHYRELGYEPGITAALDQLAVATNSQINPEGAEGWTHETSLIAQALGDRY